MSTRWHLMEGEAGCRFAATSGHVAIVVDALRASATATALLASGAQEVWAVAEVDDAFAAKGQWPDALLYGERGGIPPDGFDYGNSPREAPLARGRRVIFTTTTGAGRLVQCRGAKAVYMGTTVNARAVAQAAMRHETDVVVIPAGLMSDPHFPAQEDWVAAAVIAAVAGAQVEEGRAHYEAWRNRIEQEGVLALFESAPHADKLRKVNLEADIPVCAERDSYGIAPRVHEWNELGGVLRSD